MSAGNYIMPSVAPKGTNLITSQPGPQTQFLASSADVVFYGGQAGGGKSYALKLEPCRHIKNPRFRGLILRRTMKNVTNPGGLWDTSMQLYPLLGARPLVSDHKWIFPSGAEIKFSQIEYEKDLLGYQSSQIDYIAFDEGTEFTKNMFFFMFSRNRSMSGIRPYIRLTCNPDPDSFVKEMISWYLDENLEYPFYGRCGQIRWFCRINDEIFWADTRKKLILQFGPDCEPKSFTFIPSKLDDNQILLRSNPGYKASLKAMHPVDQERFLHGNWAIRFSAGKVFRTEWFPIIEALPAGWIECVRYWDFAWSEKKDVNSSDPDWTVGMKLYKYPDGTFVFADEVRFRGTANAIDSALKNTASQDGHNCKIRCWQDPGAGKYQTATIVKLLAGYDVKGIPATKDKLTYAKPLASQAEVGNVKLLTGKWNDAYIRELHSFPTKGTHDDRVDASSGAFKSLTDEHVFYAGVA